MEDDQTTEIHIKQALSSLKIMDLMDRYPNLQTITCPKSVYKRISKTYIDALESLDIEVKIKYNWGRRPKYDMLKSKVIKLAKSGLSAKAIARQLEIPLNKVYYLARTSDENFKFNDYKRKYDDNKRKMVRKLKDEGRKPKEISEELDIPVRTVYYILNKK